MKQIFRSAWCAISKSTDLSDPVAACVLAPQSVFTFKAAKMDNVNDNVEMSQMGKRYDEGTVNHLNPQLPLTLWSFIISFGSLFSLSGPHFSVSKKALKKKKKVATIGYIPQELVETKAELQVSECWTHSPETWFQMKGHVSPLVLDD